MSLAEMFRKKKADIAKKYEEKKIADKTDENNTKTVKPERTKEEILKLRREMMKRP